LEKVTSEEGEEWPGGRKEMDWAVACGVSKARNSTRIAVCTATIRGISGSIEYSCVQLRVFILKKSNEVLLPYKGVNQSTVDRMLFQL
jgi:hypothetical protein